MQDNELINVAAIKPIIADIYSTIKSYADTSTSSNRYYWTECLAFSNTDNFNEDGSLKTTVLTPANVGVAPDGENGITFYLLENSIVGVKWVGDITTVPANIILPSSITVNEIEYPVVEIGTSAFKNATTLISITIPDSIKWIAADAFEGCTGLTTEIDRSKYSTNVSILYPGIEYAMQEILNGKY